MVIASAVLIPVSIETGAKKYNTVTQMVEQDMIYTCKDLAGDYIRVKVSNQNEAIVNAMTKAKAEGKELHVVLTICSHGRGGTTGNHIYVKEVEGVTTIKKLSRASV